MKFKSKILSVVCLLGLVALGAGCSGASLSKQNYQKLAPAPAPQKAPVIPTEASKIPRPL
ncbi:MAG: hypothetical protein WCW31_03865 [Patescibacteria group bacterium]